MTKAEFIAEIKKEPKESVYKKFSNNYDMKAVFKNMSTKNKKWFKVTYSDVKGPGRLKKYAELQSSKISDIIANVKETI